MSEPTRFNLKDGGLISGSDGLFVRWKEVEKLREAVRNKDAELSRLRGRLAELEEGYPGIAADFENCKAELSRLRKENDALNKQIVDLSMEIGQLKTAPIVRRETDANRPIEDMHFGAKNPQETFNELVEQNNNCEEELSRLRDALQDMVDVFQNPTTTGEANALRDARKALSGHVDEPKDGDPIPGDPMPDDLKLRYSHVDEAVCVWEWHPVNKWYHTECGRFESKGSDWQPSGNCGCGRRIQVKEG